MNDPAFDVTQAGNVLPFPSGLAGLTETETLAQRARNIAAQVAELRERNVALSNTIVGAYHRSIQLELEARAQDLTRSAPSSLLDVLSAEGFAWRDIAKMLHVSVPAVRRWRSGEMPTGQHRVAIARLVSFIKILSTDFGVEAVASWLEIPLVEGLATSGIDLYAADRLDLLCDLAAGRLRAEVAMDTAFQGWRGRVDHEWQVETAPDGLPMISPRQAPDGPGDV